MADTLYLIGKIVFLVIAWLIIMRLFRKDRASCPSAETGNYNSTRGHSQKNTSVAWNDLPDGPSTVTTTKKISGFKIPDRTIGTRIAEREVPEVNLTYEAEPGVKEALNAIDSGTPALFVLGRAGTGKTTLIRYISNARSRARQVVLAPTGIAALNAGGQTVHSFFHFPPRLLDTRTLSDDRPRRIWKTIDRIIIDEVSMVRADLIDAVDFRLRRARGDERPFGGVQMILVGDFLQLPPVVPTAENEMLTRLGYSSPYAFSARSIADVDAGFVYLPTVRRQSDPRFIELLGKLRQGTNIDDAVDILNNSCCRPHRVGSIPIILTGSNARADSYNRVGLDSINAKERTYHGELKGTFDQRRDRLPAPETLTLKPGSRVMAIKNDGRGGRWVNGSCGTVDRLEADQVWVRFDESGSTDELERQTWENIRYRWNEERKRVETDVIGSFVQFPLTLAWAATIHKAQGLSLDDVRVDLEAGAFASGQAYVAISRARSLDGLSLTRPLRPTDFFVDQVLLDFERWSQDGAH